ncbi:hypothetical protein [Enterobacter ludwigii]|uniref:hypothetical protein n=1 Tax=Enterobacter ludwigii TaxID=299767 RepID=UPI003F701A46
MLIINTYSDDRVAELLLNNEGYKQVIIVAHGLFDCEYHDIESTDFIAVDKNNDIVRGHTCVSSFKGRKTHIDAVINKDK